LSSIKVDFNALDLVFVYGSLKEGMWNNRLLYDSELIGAYVTYDKFLLGDVGVPYAFPECVLPSEVKHKAKPILGEVWRMDDFITFSLLDSLEGHPRHYYRTLTETDYGPCWIYVNPDAEDIALCDECPVEMYDSQEVYKWR